MASFFGGGNKEEQLPVETVSFMSSGSGAAQVTEGSAADEFWARERAWQIGELEKPFTVTISDPRTEGGTLTSYTSYHVSCTLLPDGVRRRYSDFDWLRDILVARYHGIAVPLMPEKRLVGNQSKSFIEERMQGLENFLLLVLASPYLRADVTLRMFLTTINNAEYEQGKKAHTSGMGADPSANPGLRAWFGVLRHLNLPLDADAAASELAAFVDDSEAKVTAALAAVTRYYEAAKATTDSLRALRDALADWTTGCTSAASALSETLAPVRSSLSVLGVRLKKGCDAFSNVYDLSVFAPNEVQIFLMDGLVTEIHRLRSLKALLGVRDSAKKAYSAAWFAQDKLQFQAKQWRDKGRSDKADALEPKIAEAVATLKRMKDRLDDVSKGVLHVEADRVNRTRIDRFTAMAGQYAALCIASGVRTQELWSVFLNNMELDQGSCVLDAQATLTCQMSMHTLDATGPATTLTLPSARLGAPHALRVNGQGPVGAAAQAAAAPAPASPAPAPVQASPVKEAPAPVAAPASPAPVFAAPSAPVFESPAAPVFVPEPVSFAAPTTSAVTADMFALPSASESESVPPPAPAAEEAAPEGFQEATL